MKHSPAPALDFFLPGQSIAQLTPLGRGKINDSWQIQLFSGRRLILQRLSTAVFSDPRAVLANLRIVLNHLARSQEQRSVENFSSFQLLTAPRGDDLYQDEHGHCWRLFSAIHPSATLETIHSPEQGYGIGAMLGHFHLLLADMDPQQLNDPLPGFHDTAAYLCSYDRLVAKSSARPAREENERQCHRFISHQRFLVPLFQEKSSLLTRGLTHGDPKVSNFLFTPDRQQVISLIDLDTVRQGFLLHDLGDCLRSCCNPRGENHQEPGATRVAVAIYAGVVRGYRSVAGHLLSTMDLQLLPRAMALICFELGLRFFTDHLQGDLYFKTSRPGQNLHRALIQFHLAQSVCRQEAELLQITEI